MSWKIMVGDVLDKLAEIESGSVQCVVTSPPYWGLRDYGVEGMIGLEPTLAEHMAKIVEVFGEVRRVLRDDGTLWLNYGDAYAQAEQRNRNGKGGTTVTERTGTHFTGVRCSSGLANKQRMMLPARVALALQDSGWWVRSEIVWAKGVSFCPTYSGSCMPSSVRDRPTDSHEMLYLLTKAPRYFYDGDAVREARSAGSVARFPDGERRDNGGKYEGITPHAGSGEHNFVTNSAGRNLRTVWTINPKGYKEAHFATYPEALVEPCLKAGTSEHGACSECGAPWRRVVEKTTTPTKRVHNGDYDDSSGFASGWIPGKQSVKTTGWEPTCDHPDAPVRPCLVLDPFNGSGTTGTVAVRLGCDYVGIELNPEYAELAHKRIGRAAAEIGQGGDVSANEDPKRAQMGLFQ